MSTLDRAIQIASQAHEGQTDRQGEPYILHPIRVMQGVEGLSAKMVAILHDVVEDTKVTLDDLKREGFGPEILDAVRLVTRVEGESYAEYVVRCRDNPLAKAVKLSDLTDNTRLSRSLMRPQLLGRDQNRYARYLLAYAFLTDTLPESDYRAAMKTLEEPAVGKA